MIVQGILLPEIMNTKKLVCPATDFDYPFERSSIDISAIKPQPTTTCFAMSFSSVCKACRMPHSTSQSSDMLTEFLLRAWPTEQYCHLVFHNIIT